VALNASGVARQVTQGVAGSVAGKAAKTQVAHSLRETWLPFTERLVLRPDISYLAKSALLTRLLIGMARSWSNTPSHIDDPRLSPPQKKQAFLESCFKELFGTPSYMLVMHLASDGVGAMLQKLGFIPKQFKVSGVSASDLAQANQVLRQMLGKTGWAGKAVFNPADISLTRFKTLLSQQHLGHLLANPAFDQAMVNLFKRVKLSGSLGFVAQMAANILYGGVFIQQFNDRAVAPFLEKRLYRVDKPRFQGPPPTEAGGIIA
jgi:hypothetical protein